MATEIKGLFSRANIRTMKKDIAMAKRAENPINKKVIKELYDKPVIEEPVRIPTNNVPGGEQRRKFIEDVEYENEKRNN